MANTSRASQIKYTPRGKLIENAPLAPYTWFRVGGPADVLFMPADEEDLQAFLSEVPSDVPVTVIGLGSNMIIRDGGVRGVVIRLSAKGFGQITHDDELTLTAGAIVPDVKLASAAADNSINRLQFFRGIPGAIGGAVKMNAGAYGGETKDNLIHATGITRQGKKVTLTPQDLGHTYRHSSFADDIIITSATFKGERGDSETIKQEMRDISERREQSQPIKEKTGGSTFKNPDGYKSWQLIDAAGLRGHKIGGAEVSQKHCNFLINTGNATAADIENLGEYVREKVLQHSGVELNWEIKRIGEFA